MTYVTEQQVTRDLSFRAGPRPGDAMPDFDLPTTDGGRIKKDDYVGFRPLVLMFGSISCPMTASSAPKMAKLYGELGDRAEFALVYVREAAPGDRWRQPRSFDEKLAHARALKLRDRLLFPVAVDDVEGTFHRRLDPKPNAVYVMDSDGNVAFRSVWASDERALRRAIDRAVEHRMTKEKLSRVMPVVQRLREVRETVTHVGSGPARGIALAALGVLLLGGAAALAARHSHWR